MSSKSHPISSSAFFSRRQMIAGSALALGTLAATRTWGQAPPAADADKARTSLHQEIDYLVGPNRIYDALLDSRQFGAFTGEHAEISLDEGGAFTLFGGKIVGRNIELVSGERIVQAWRPAYWPAGVYSLVRFELKGLGSECKVVLDHTSFPAGHFTTLNSGWYERYWDPLRKFVGAAR